MRHPDYQPVPPARRWSGVFLIIASSLLGGCAVGPDFHSPAATSAKKFQVKVPVTDTVGSNGTGGISQHFISNSPIAADWYRLFQSPVLDHLIARALENNPSLAASQASLKQAAYELKAVSGSSLPNMDIGAGAGRQRANGAQIGLNNPLFDNVFNLYTTRLSLSYDLDLFGASRRETEAQQANVAYQQDMLRGSRLTLVDNLVVTLVRYAALHDRLAAMHNIIQTEQDQLELLSKQEKAGAAAYADVLRARAELADNQAQLPALQHQQTVTAHALARLVGEDPANFVPPSLSLNDLHLPANLPVSLPSEIVRQRPDILAAEQLLHAASAQVGVATAHLYPNITLSADLGSATNEAGGLLDSPARVWSLGGSLFAPIFHGGSLRAQRKASEAQLQLRYDQYKQTVLNAFGQVDDVLDAINEDAETLKAQNHALEANKQSLDLVRKQYQAGAASYLDVLTAERHYNQAQLARVQADSQRFIDTAALYHSLGGGWWNTSTNSKNRTSSHSHDSAGGTHG